MWYETEKDCFRKNEKSSSEIASDDEDSLDLVVVPQKDRQCVMANSLHPVELMVSKWQDHFNR